MSIIVEHGGNAMKSKLQSLSHGKLSMSHLGVLLEPITTK